MAAGSGRVLGLGRSGGRRGGREKSTYIVEFYWELLVFCNMLGHLWPLWWSRGVLAHAVGIVQQLGGVEGGHSASRLIDPTCSRPFAFKHCLANAVQAVNNHAILKKQEPQNFSAISPLDHTVSGHINVFSALHHQQIMKPHIYIVNHLWPVWCSQHVPSTLERVWRVVGDAILSYMGVLCFILRSAERCHTVLIKSLYTCNSGDWEKSAKRHLRSTKNATEKMHFLNLEKLTVSTPNKTLLALSFLELA